MNRVKDSNDDNESSQKDKSNRDFAAPKYEARILEESKRDDIPYFPSKVSENYISEKERKASQLAYDKSYNAEKYSESTVLERTNISFTQLENHNWKPYQNSPNELAVTNWMCSGFYRWRWLLLKLFHYELPLLRFSLGLSSCSRL